MDTNNVINKIFFNLHFMHSFFNKQNRDSCKNYSKEGGGINFYYLIHIFYALSKVFNSIKIKKIEFNKNITSSVIKNFFLLFEADKKNIIYIKVVLSKKKLLHKYTIINQNKYIECYSSLSDWYGEYIFKSQTTNKKIYNIVKKKERVSNFTKKNYEILINKNFKHFKEEYKSILYAHKACIKINKKIKKYDFKRM